MLIYISLAAPGLVNQSTLIVCERVTKTRERNVLPRVAGDDANGGITGVVLTLVSKHLLTPWVWVTTAEESDL